MSSVIVAIADHLQEPLRFSNRPTCVLAIRFQDCTEAIQLNYHLLSSLTWVYDNTTMTNLKDPRHETNGIDNRLSNGHTTLSTSSLNAWSTPGSAAFDFRSTRSPNSSSPSLNPSIDTIQATLSPPPPPPCWPPPSTAPSSTTSSAKTPPPYPSNPTSPP